MRSKDSTSSPTAIEVEAAARFTDAQADPPSGTQVTAMGRRTCKGNTDAGFAKAVPGRARVRAPLALLRGATGSMAADVTTALQMSWDRVRGSGISVAGSPPGRVDEPAGERYRK